MLLGSQRSILRKEGLGYEPNDTTRLNEGTKWVKEGIEDFSKFPEPQDVSTVANIEEKKKKSRNYLMNETIRGDPRYKYSYSYGMLGEHKIVDKLIDPTGSTFREPFKEDHNRVIYSRSAPTRDRQRLVGRIDRVGYNREFSKASITPHMVCEIDPYRMDPRAYIPYHNMVEHPQFFPTTHHPIIPHVLSPCGIVNSIPKFRLPQRPPWTPMGWN